MKLNPEAKTRTAVYIGLIVVAGGAAAYFAFAGGREPPVNTAVQKRVAEIQAGAAAEQPPPELPVDKRPPRNARAPVK